LSTRVALDSTSRARGVVEQLREGADVRRVEADHPDAQGL
jgi:hypothetical protein